MAGKGGVCALYLTLHCPHWIDFCIKTDSDVSHFNASLTVRDSHGTVSTKGERKRRIEPTRPPAGLSLYRLATATNLLKPFKLRLNVISLSNPAMHHSTVSPRYYVNNYRCHLNFNGRHSTAKLNNYVFTLRLYNHQV